MNTTRYAFEKWIADQPLSSTVTINDLDRLFVQYLQGCENTVFPLKSLDGQEGYFVANKQKQDFCPVPAWWPYWVEKIRYALDEEFPAPFYKVIAAVNEIRQQEMEMELYLLKATHLESTLTFWKGNYSQLPTEFRIRVHDDAIDENILMALTAQPRLPKIQYRIENKYLKKLALESGGIDRLYADIPCPAWLCELQVAIVQSNRIMTSYHDLYMHLRDYYGLDL